MSQTEQAPSNAFYSLSARLFYTQHYKIAQTFEAQIVSSIFFFFFTIYPKYQFKYEWIKL